MTPDTELTPTRITKPATGLGVRLAALLLAASVSGGTVYLAKGQSPAAPEAPQGPTVPAGQIATAKTPAPKLAAAPQAPKARRPRGAKPSPRWKIFAAVKHIAKAVPPQFTPAVILSPSQMSYWGNDVDGDCVTAEEAFAKDIYPVWYSATGKPVDLPSATVTAWARSHGFLNGADLTTVMETMASAGMVSGGTTYTDGPYQSVDFTSWAALTSAISQGPVKLGVASGQFDNVSGVGEQNGWIMTGFSQDESEDHCVSLCGYGTMQQLATAMGVSLPSGVNGSGNGLLLFTWDSIGIIDFQSMANITGEAWLRTPTTPQTPPPTPAPQPAPTPTPSPTPAPTPSPPPTPAPAPVPTPSTVTTGTPPPGQPQTMSLTWDWPSGALIVQAQYGAAWWQPSRDGTWYTSADQAALRAFVAQHDAGLHESQVRPLPTHPASSVHAVPDPVKPPAAIPTITASGTFSVNGGPSQTLFPPTTVYPAQQAPK